MSQSRLNALSTIKIRWFDAMYNEVKLKRQNGNHYSCTVIRWTTISFAAQYFSWTTRKYFEIYRVFITKTKQNHSEYRHLLSKLFDWSNSIVWINNWALQYRVTRNSSKVKVIWSGENTFIIFIIWFCNWNAEFQ